MAHGLLSIVDEIALWTTVNCQPLDVSAVNSLLSVTRYAGILTTLTLWVASIRYCEVYLFLFGLASLLNYAINVLLRVTVRDQSSVVSSCIDAYAIGGSNWPSYQSQDTAFVFTFVLCYALIYRARSHPFSVLTLVAYTVAVIVGDKALNYHTTSQIVGGVLVGTAFALLSQLLIRFAVAPCIPSLLRLSAVRYMAYEDTLLYDAKLQ